MCRKDQDSRNQCDTVTGFTGEILIGERSEPPMSVELSDLSLYSVFIYIYIYIRPYVVHVPLTRNAQTSDGRLRFNGQY